MSGGRALELGGSVELPEPLGPLAAALSDVAGAGLAVVAGAGGRPALRRLEPWAEVPADLPARLAPWRGVVGWALGHPAWWDHVRGARAVPTRLALGALLPPWCVVCGPAGGPAGPEAWWSHEAVPVCWHCADPELAGPFPGGEASRVSDLLARALGARPVQESRGLPDGWAIANPGGRCGFCGGWAAAQDEVGRPRHVRCGVAA